MSHHCHFPGCSKEVPPKMWGCYSHWMQIPRHLQAKIWETYVPGQEVRKDPSSEYIKAAREVRIWCLRKGGGIPQTDYDRKIASLPDPFDFDEWWRKEDA